MLSRIGCEKLGSNPGTLESASSNRLSSSSLVSLLFHCSCGYDIHQELGHVDLLGIGAVLGTAGLGDHRAHFREMS